jgi:DNA-binding transcriptional MocR family regulator
MSFKALAWALGQGVKNPDKAVLIVLAYRDNHDEPHGCYPSLVRMAEDCGLDKSTIVRCLERLEASGKIARKARVDENGRQTSNYYSFPEVYSVAVGNRPVAQGNSPSRSVQQSPVAVGNTNVKDLTENEKKEWVPLDQVPSYSKEKMEKREAIKREWEALRKGNKLPIELRDLTAYRQYREKNP